MTSLSSSLRAPAEFSLLFDPLWVKQAFRLEDDTAPLDSGLDWIYRVITRTERINHTLYLRRESLRMRATADLDTLSALLLGRIEFRYTPDNPLVQTIFERIYHEIVHPLWEIALRDYLTLGVGGVALSPLGIQPVRPELACAYPNWITPRWTARVVAVHWDIARKMFRHPVFARWQAMRRDERAEQPKQERRDPFVDDESLVIPIIEIIDVDKIYYYFWNEKVAEYPREARYGHFFLVGDERTIHPYDTFYADSSLGYREYVRQYEQARLGYYYISEHDDSWIDYPVGILERAVRTRYRGYNLYEAHERIIESLVKEVLKGRYALYQFDIFDEDSPIFHEFEEIYNAIGYNSPEPVQKPPITFLGGISLPEIQAGLRELEGILTIITGVNPYMLGQVGVTKVASEVVAMTQQTNLKLQRLHEVVARSLESFVRAFHLYLIQLPESNQSLFVEPYTKDGESRYAIVGKPTERMRTNPFYEMVGDFYTYEQFFSQTRIELAYTGHVSLMERRNNYMQALQLLSSVLQLLMQMGQPYQIAPLVDRILQDLGVDISALKPQAAPNEPMSNEPVLSEQALLSQLGAGVPPVSSVPSALSPVLAMDTPPDMAAMDPNLIANALLIDPELGDVEDSSAVMPS